MAKNETTVLIPYAVQPAGEPLWELEYRTAAWGGDAPEPAPEWLTEVPSEGANLEPTGQRRPVLITEGDDAGFQAETEPEPYTVHVRVRMRGGMSIMAALPTISNIMGTLRGIDIDSETAEDPQAVLNLVALVGGLLNVIVTRKDENIWRLLLSGEYRGGNGPGYPAAVPSDATCSVDFLGLLPVLTTVLQGAGVSLGGA